MMPGDVRQGPGTSHPGEPYGAPPSSSSGNGGGYGALDTRLRSVELDVREIKTDMKHVATRAWVLGGVLAAAGVGAGIALAVLRFFSP